MNGDDIINYHETFKCPYCGDVNNTEYAIQNVHTRDIVCCSLCKPRYVANLNQ